MGLKLPMYYGIHHFNPSLTPHGTPTLLSLG